jgi:hypothetical protein
MSSTSSILRASTRIVKEHILPQVPKKWAPQVAFGTNALSLHSLISCNANARMVISAKRGVAETKISRLLANTKLPSAIASVVAELKLVTSHSYVNVDHSDFSGLVALVFAVQTRIGRALPIFLQTSYSGKLSARADAPKRIKQLRTQYEALEDNETKRTIAALKALGATLGFWPKLVFDRGFGSREIIRLLAREDATFYIRLKAGRLVEIAGTRSNANTGTGEGLVRVSAAKRTDETVVVGGMTLRVIRSPKPKKGATSGRTGSDATEPWYILTNDAVSSRNKVVRIYYHRFEIEETFRDIKTILGLRRTKLNKPNSLAILLWFVSLGILILYLAGIGVLGKRALMRLLRQPHPKKRLSWYRILMELRECEIYALSYTPNKLKSTQPC